MADDDIDIRVRLRDARRAQQEAKATAGAVRGIGDAGRHVRTNMRDLGAGGMQQLRSGAVAAGLAVGALGAVGVRSGLQFNASMQSAQLRFGLFTDDAEALVGAVQAIDEQSTFNLTSLSNATAYLGNAGIKAGKLELALQGVANAAAAAGGGDERLMRISTALGQIQARGTITAEEVNQLADAGVNVRETLRREFGLSGKDLANLGEQGISSGKAINAILGDWTSGKMAAAAKAQTSTLGGQWDLLTGNAQKLSGAVTEGLAGALQRDLLPAANDASEALTKLFQRDDLSLEQKMTRAGQILKPLARQAGAAIEELHLDQRLADALEAAAPVIAGAAVDVAGQAAKAFIRAWLDAPIWAQLFSVAWLAKKIGAFSMLGAMAATRFWDGWDRKEKARKEDRPTGAARRASGIKEAGWRPAGGHSRCRDAQVGWALRATQNPPRARCAGGRRDREVGRRPDPPEPRDVGLQGKARR